MIVGPGSTALAGWNLLSIISYEIDRLCFVPSQPLSAFSDGYRVVRPQREGRALPTP
nr:hypothetical protein Q903MT_gene4962 [Picea sitchensis]